MKIIHKKRLMVGSLLAVSLGALMAYSSLGYSIFDPNIYQILQNFEQNNNTQVSFSGQIIKVTTPNNMTILASEPPYPKIVVDPSNTSLTLKKGDIIEILGILDGKNHVTATKILKMEQWKLDLVYIRSLPAIPFALYLFFKAYSFNRKTFRFVRRKT